MDEHAIQVVHDCSGDHRNGAMWSPGWTDPVGSNSRQVPSADRATEVASMTSGLVEVDTTGPLLANTFGMINDVVFPDAADRGSSPNAGGRRSTNRVRCVPDTAPWPAPADAANAALWRETDPM